MIGNDKKVEKQYLLVTEYFHPDTASTGQLMTDLAVGLKKRGLDMTVYTSQPNYHSGNNEKQPYTENYKGVQVKRILAPQFREKSLFHRGINWIIFIFWMFFKLLILSPRDRELIFVSNPPFLPIAIWVLHRLRGYSYRYIVYDVYPEAAVKLGFIKHNGLIHKIWSWAHQQVLEDATSIIALGPEMKKKLAEEGGENFNPEKIEVIDNWADEEAIERKEKDENWFSQKHGLVDKFAVLYSGNIGKHHDLETLVKSSIYFDEEDMCFLIIGEGEEKERIKDLAASLDTIGSVVHFLPYQPLEHLPYSLTAGDVSVVTVRNKFKGICVSSKIYTALAVGQPILLIARDDSYEADIIRKHNAGIRVDPKDVTGVVEAINRWQSNPDLVEQQGRNAREAFENNYTKQHSINKYFCHLTNKEI